MTNPGGTPWLAWVASAALLTACGRGGATFAARAPDTGVDGAAGVEDAPGGAGGAAAAVVDETAADGAGGCPRAVEVSNPSAECLEFDERVCARVVECVPDRQSHHAPLGPADLKACLASLAARCVGVGLPGSALDRAALDACIERLEAGSCALVLEAVPLYGMRACTSPGTRDGGEPCEEHQQCRSGACLDGACEVPRADTPVRYSWQGVLDEGDPVGPDGRCNNRFLTPVDGRCERTGHGGEGDACPCDPLSGLLCTCGGRPCDCEQPQSGGICTGEGVCAPPPILAEGQSCGTHLKGISAAPGTCEPGTACVDQGGPGSCVVLVGAGEACTRGWDGRSDDCQPGLSCVYPADGDTQGICRDCGG